MNRMSCSIKESVPSEAKYWANFTTTAEGVPTANSLSALLHSRPINSTVSLPTEEPKADLWCTIKLSHPLQRSGNKVTKTGGINGQVWEGFLQPTGATSIGFLLFQRSSSSHRIWQTGATFRASVVTSTSHWVCVFEDSTLEGATSVAPKPAARRHRQAGLHRDYEGTTAATRCKRLAVQLQRVIKIQHKCLSVVNQ